MPIALGIGAAILLVIALAKKSSSHRPSNVPTTPDIANAPRVTPPIPEERLAAEAVRNGQGTAEDFETLADFAERQGDSQTADQLRNRATVAPERATLEQAREHEEEAPAPGTFEDGTPVLNPPTPQPAPAPTPQPAPATTPQPAPATTPQPAPVTTPTPQDFNPSEASRLASAIASNIRTKRYSYNRRGLAVFQRAAGLTPDGLYGGKSAGALVFYGVSPPPRPLFKSHGSFAVVSYPSNLSNAARAARQ